MFVVFLVLMLQWGHSFSAVEMGYVDSDEPEVKSLQWGHNFSAVEISSVTPLNSTHMPASMGPQLFSRGDDQNLCV